MTTIWLYKFISQTGIEYHADTKYLFIPLYLDLLADFTKQISSFLKDEGHECHLKEGYLVVDIAPILDYYEINHEDLID